MELKLEETESDYIVSVSLIIEETEEPKSQYRMTADINIPKGQCQNEKAMLLAVQGAASHLSTKLVNPWRVSMMHSLREAIVSTIQTAQTAPREATGSAPEGAAAIGVAEGVVPTSPVAPETACSHDVIYAPNDGSLFGKCTSCQETEIPVIGYAQSATRSEGFLTRLRRDGDD